MLISDTPSRDGRFGRCRRKLTLDADQPTQRPLWHHPRPPIPARAQGRQRGQKVKVQAAQRRAQNSESDQAQAAQRGVDKADHAGQKVSGGAWRGRCASVASLTRRGWFHRKDDYAFFIRPVDPAQVPGYADVIKNPMDFGTMTVKVTKGKYRSLEEFTVRLPSGLVVYFTTSGSHFFFATGRLSPRDDQRKDVQSAWVDIPR